MKGLVQNMTPNFVSLIQNELFGYERVLFDKMVEHAKSNPNKKIDFGVIRSELGWSEMHFYNVKIGLRKDLAVAHKRIYDEDSYYHENIWTRV